MKVFCVLVFAIGLASSSCDIADEDRCPSGMEWVAQYNSCILTPEDEQDTDTNGDDGGSDDGGPDDGGVSGMGEECTGDPDCAGYEADYCGLDPFAPGDPGYCTIYDCAAGECPGEYQCCDCTSVGADAPVCMNAEDAATAIGFGCTCS